LTGFVEARADAGLPETVAEKQNKKDTQGERKWTGKRKGEGRGGGRCSVMQERLRMASFLFWVNWQGTVLAGWLGNSCRFGYLGYLRGCEHGARRQPDESLCPI
jgi:hypothetical protein